MRKLYELEMTKDEVDTLVFTVEFFQEERDLDEFLTVLAQELKAQRDRDEVGMTEILLNYQEAVRVEQRLDQRIEEEVKEYGEALDAVAGDEVAEATRFLRGELDRLEGMLSQREEVVITLKPAEATILEGFLRRHGKEEVRRSKIHPTGPFAERAAVLLEVANQIQHQKWLRVNRLRCEIQSLKTPFSDAPPITYTQLLDGLVKELQGRTVESDNHDDWSQVLRSTADQLEDLHLKANSWR